MKSCLRYALLVRRCSPRARLWSLRPCRGGFREIHLCCSHHVRQYSSNASLANEKVPSNLSGETRTISGRDDATIYALSTAPGRAAIAIVRISGPACMVIYHVLCPGRPPPEPRKATLRTLYDPNQQGWASAPVLDSGALVLYFPSPQSVTGEDVLEFHLHGGPTIVKAVLAAIPAAVRRSPDSSNHVVRYAEPGEFTRRAFHNNRLELTQLEALGDSLSAETEQQRRLAVKGIKNSLAKRYESWRQQLLSARGELEALIDFSEDQHFEESPANLVSSVAEQVEQLSSRVQASILNASRGELLRGGISIALLGAPNAGKSSLLNMVVGREAAIVSKEAGTTRDVIEVGVDIGGYYCRFGDLAGLRGGSPKECGSTSTTDNIGEVEEEGIRRAKERALAADVVVVVLSLEHSEEGPLNLHLNSEVRATIAKCDSDRQQIIYVVNKWDLVRIHSPSRQRVLRENILQSLAADPDLQTVHRPVLFVSCEDAREGRSTARDQESIQWFLQKLIIIFEKMTSVVAIDGETKFQGIRAWDESLGASERQRLLLQQCLDHLNNFVLQVKRSQGQSDSNLDDTDVDVVLAAESLRAAAECLAKITGKGVTGDVEEVLGVVFEK